MPSKVRGRPDRPLPPPAAAVVTTSVVAWTVVAWRNPARTVISTGTPIGRGRNVSRPRSVISISRADSNADADSTDPNSNCDARCSECRTANQEQESKQFGFHDLSPYTPYIGKHRANGDHLWNIQHARDSCSSGLADYHQGD
jgi:hypothetical protein